MKNVYIRFCSYFIFLLFIVYANETYAQKNLKLRINSVRYQQSSGTDCDGNVCVGGNGRIDIAFDIDDGGTDVDEACHEGAENTTDYTWSANFATWDRNYDFACQWPTGNISFIIEAWDRDGNVCIYDQCIGGGFANASADKICDVSMVIPWPSDANGTNVGTPRTCTFNANFDGGGNCGGTITVNYQWEVSGNYRSQSSDDYICGAYNLGTLNSGGTLNRNNFSNIGYTTEDICASNEPNNDSGDETVWLKFTTGANPGTELTVDADAIGGSGTGGTLCISGGTVFAWTRVYEGPTTLTGCPFTYSTNPFTQLNQVGSVGSIGTDNSLINLKCPKANQTYYIQVEMQGIATCDMGRFNISVSDNGKQMGPDRICNARDLGTFTNGADISLDVYNQSNACATVGSCEPDNMDGSLDKTVWYKFTTPPAYYLDGTLPNLYTVEIERTGGGAFDHIPAYSLWRQTAATTRNCPENCASFANLQHVGAETWTSIGNALRNLCLAPNTTYFIQVDHTCASCVFGIDDYVEFNVHVRKSTYQPPNNICEAVDLGYITSNGTATGTPTNINWHTGNKFNLPPFNGLPHSNRCKTTENGEPNATLNQDETVWYKFTTGVVAPDWIGWYQSDGSCAAPGLLSSFFNSRVNFYKSNNSSTCPIGANLDLQPEKNLPGEPCDVNTGIGFGAPCYADFFRLKCPEPNTTYWVQVQAASFSVCEEGLWSFNNGTSGWIRTAPTINPGNPWDEPCTAYNLGTIPNGGSQVGNLDNFCATARQEFRADFNQPLERDVWIKFKPPASGSVKVTAVSGTGGGIDNDLDIQMACWEPIMGELVPSGTATNAQNHCADLRFLWTPRLAQDHGLCELSEQQTGSTNCFLGGFSAYDIYNTCGNSILCNEGNSFLVTCLDPQKTYFLQVDGGQYPLCDLLDAGDCIMGNFRVTVSDASLGSIDPASPTNGNTGNQPNFLNDEPCFARPLPVQGSGVGYGSLSWALMTNRCATSITDPIPSRWQAVNSSTDNTVWASFIAPTSGRVKIRAENIGQIKGDADWHDDINIQLAVYQANPSCFDKNLAEVITNHESGFDGALDEANPASNEYVGVCVCGIVPDCGFDEYYTVKCLIPGQKYYIMIDGDAGYTCGANAEDILGDFRISVQDLGGTARSTNDSVCQAYEILNTATMAVNASITTGNFNNECASIQPWLEGPGKLAAEINDNDVISFGTINVEHTLWFKFRAPSTGKVLIEGINTGSDDLDIGMALFDFPFENCANAAQGVKIAQDYDAGIVGFGIDEDFEVECLVPGRYYYLQVDGDRNAVYNPLDPSGTETGEFRLRITHLPMGARADIPPQNNDSLCDAINFGTIANGASVFRNDDNNRCATSEQNEPDVSGWNISYFVNQDRTVWYQFNTGANPGPINISVSDPKPALCFDVDIDLFEYTGTYSTSVCDAMALTSTQFNPLFKVAEGDIAGIGQSENITLPCPKPNKTYFLRVTGSGGLLCAGFGPDEGTFDVSISIGNTPSVKPVNDDICNAVNLGTITSGNTLFLNNQNNNCATQELNEPNTSQSCLADQSCYDETVWYYFNSGPNPGQVTINMDVTGNSISDFYANVSLFEYMGGACGSFASFDYLLQSSPFSNGFHDAQIVAPCLKPNTFYYLQCDGWDVGPLGIFGVDEQGVFSISVSDNGASTARPTNDDLAGALPIQSGTLAAGGSLTVSSHNRCATCENNEPGGLDYCGTNSTAHTALLNAEDETVWFYFTTPNKPGVTTVTVADDPGVSGSFSPNFRIYYNNGASPTYRITNAPSARLIQEGGSATGTTSASNTYTCLLPNTRYWVQIDGNDAIPFTTDQGSFILTVSDDGSGNPGPSNDLICNATTITIPANSSFAVSGTNKCSWEEADEPNTSNNQGGSGDDVTSDGYDETVWYTFIPPSDGNVTINNLSAGFNYVLYERNSTAAISGCPDPAWSQLNQIASGTATITSLTEAWGCLDDAKRYYIQIDGNDIVGTADVGTFSFSLSHSSNGLITNDMICGAINWGTITAAGASSLNQNNQCATEECGEPSVSGNCNDVTATGYDKTLWYRFTTNAVKGTYTITVANNGSPSDAIAPNISVYRQNTNVCPASTPNFSNLNLVKQNLNLGVSTGAQSLALNCWEAEPNKTYYVQVDGHDLNETGNNFNVSIAYVATPVPNDDICNAIALTVGGAAAGGDNTCAGTQANEPNLSPSAPQDPTVSGYDETLWYSFIAPASGSARVTFGGLGVLATGLNIDLNVLQAPSGNPAISCAAANQFSGLTNNSSTTIPRNNLATTHDLTCLIPGRRYYLQVDGSDASIVDRGTFTVAVSDLDPSFVAGSTVPNDEPCGAIDITQFIRTVVQGPCPSNNMNYTGQYIVTGGNPNIDRATMSAQGSPCNGPNCSDYWYRITVPNDAYGILVQGDEQNENLLNHTQNVTVYRPATNCSGAMMQIGCGSGGFTNDVNFSVAAAPGEVLYISVHNSAGTMGTNPASPSNNFGLCLSPICPPKPICNATVMQYGQPQCWNMDVDGANMTPIYYDCLPGSNNSANYFVFNTECGVNGADTVTMVFSVTDIGGSSAFCGTQTAMSIFEDATPCDGNPQSTLLNCVIWEDVTGGSTASNVAQTWILPECKTYVVQVISNHNDGDCASGGQIVVMPSVLTPTQILPVELTTFTGYNNGNINVLNWTTASELNSLKFEVEKSLDAINFSYIGERPAAGNSSTPLNYTLNDEHPVIGNNYYRLKMIDRDGSFEYSNIIIIRVNEIDAPADGIIQVYPNPTNDKLNVVYQAGTEQKVVLDIYNAIGQSMQNASYQLSAGLHTIVLDVAEYAKGMYILNMQNSLGGNRHQTKFVKD